MGRDVVVGWGEGGWRRATRRHSQWGPGDPQPSARLCDRAASAEMAEPSIR